MNPGADFMHPDQDRVISFVRDAEGGVSFSVLTRFDPLEFEGMQKVYWRKIFQSEAFADEDAAFGAARAQFAWVEAGWRDSLQI